VQVQYRTSSGVKVEKIVFLGAGINQTERPGESWVFFNMNTNAKENTFLNNQIDVHMSSHI